MIISFFGQFVHGFNQASYLVCVPYKISTLKNIPKSISHPFYDPLWQFKHNILVWFRIKQFALLQKLLLLQIFMLSAFIKRSTFYILA